MIICRKAPWYWPLHYWRAWSDLYGQRFRRCIACGEVEATE
jgi:hypothetical protein